MQKVYCGDRFHTEKPVYFYTITLVKLLPFTSRGAAGGGGSTSALRAHLPPHQGEALRGHTLPEGDVRDTDRHVSVPMTMLKWEFERESVAFSSFKVVLRIVYNIPLNGLCRFLSRGGGGGEEALLLNVAVTHRSGRKRLQELSH